MLKLSCYGLLTHWQGVSVVRPGPDRGPLWLALNATLAARPGRTNHDVFVVFQVARKDCFIRVGPLPPGVA